MTYPNVLVVDYMKRTKKINPEIQMKAEGFINVGYQRLLTFQTPAGGFAWWGPNDTPYQVITAYGVMHLKDMTKVHEVDPQVIERAQNWLVGQQRQDGSWHERGGVHADLGNVQLDDLRTTAYIAAALADSGYKGHALQKAFNYIAPKIEGIKDAYAAAVVANALVSIDRVGGASSPAAQRAIEKLVSMATEEDKVAYWKTNLPTPFNGRGASEGNGAGTGDIETTAIAAFALLKAGSHPGLVTKALTFLVRNKDAFGTWQTTQATIWSLKALLLATEKGTGETDAAVAVFINGKEANRFRITPADSDVMRQIDLKPFVREGANTVKITFEGKGASLYQISAKYYVPWDFVGEEPEPLDIDVDYDRTELQVNDTVTCRVRVTNNQPTAANMVIVDLGIPPGFEVQSGDLAELVGSKVIQKFSLTGRQIIIYLEKVEPGKPVQFSFRLKAKFPIRAKTGKSTAYEYYAPNVSGVAAPVKFTVKPSG